MSTKNIHSNLSTLNGIRFLTMCWLVYGHVYFVPIKETFKSSLSFIQSVFEIQTILIHNSWPAVDIFFIISALLHSFHLFRTMSSKTKLNIFKMIINRAARLSPSLWLTMGFVFLVPSLAQGPLWPEVMNQQVGNCYHAWWRIFLFVANQFPEKDICQVHTWYLSADMQLYVVSFFFIILIYK